jgi:ketosteroid isomerase-like protein
MKKLAIVPGDRMINGTQVTVIDPIENKGVLLKDCYGRVITFIKEQDNELAAHYAKEITKFVMACADNRFYKMNFELPAKHSK